MKKKQKKLKRRQTAAQDEERREELLGLSLIYEDLIEEEENSFHVRVVPHPGDQDTNHVAITLNVSLPWGYPAEEVELRLTDAVGLRDSDVRSVSKALHSAAVDYAKAGEMCCFQLIQLCQELLQEHNASSADGAAEPPVLSLYEEMHQRGIAEAAEPSGIAASAEPWAFETFDWADGGLFADPDDGGWTSATAATVPTVHIAANPPRPPRTGALVPSEATQAAIRAVPPPPLPEEPSAQPTHELGRHATSPAELSSLTAPAPAHGQSFSTRVLSFGKAAQALLPKALRRFLDSSATGGSASDAGSEAPASSVSPEDEAERDQLRRELLLGHLLSLAAGGSPLVPPHTLPAVAAMLQQHNLLPRWLSWVLTHQPAAFDRAFKRTFAEEVAAAHAAGATPDAGDPTAAWALDRFWQRHTPAGGGHLRWASLGGGLDVAPPSALPPSRYEADFSEVRQLGRGGYGVVSLAINRFDGRQYAVKRITLSQHSPAAYARIMREVATLSRLQHPHVVRYFQAWVEATAGDGAAEGDDEGTEDSELGAWASGTGAASVAAGAPGAGAGSGTALPVPNPMRSSALSAVAETSREGRPSTPSDGTALGDISLDDFAFSSGGGGLNAAVAGAGKLLARRSAACSSSSNESEGQGWGRRGGSSAYDATTSDSAFTFDRSKLSSGLTLLSGAQGGGAGGGSSRPGSAAPGFRRHLYIQMEYCRSTLRDMLDSGPLPEEVRWNVLRQLLSGLAHIHTQGIIHRDLKPANLFEDARGDIKLGDFGLAKFTAAPGDEAPTPPAPPALAAAPGKPPAAPSSLQMPVGPAMSHAPSDTTGMVGTSHYMAPEIVSGWASYDERVDIYACGVIAFECWHPFSTAMERALLLRDLRERGALPAAFEAAHPQVSRLIRWLMAPKPADRPTAKEVLRSELLPPTVGDEALTDVLRSLPDNPVAADRVVDALFARKEGTSATAAEAAGAPCPSGRHPESRDRVMDALRSAFSRHGAVPMCSLEVGAAAADDPKAAVQVLARTGEQLALRYELRQPFCAWVAQQVGAGSGAALLEGLRRYEIAAVHRRGAGQSLPRSHLQADFDILTPGGRGGGAAGEPPVVEAEVICAVADLLGELPECSGRWEVRLGHRGLFEAALQHAGVTKGLRAGAVQLLRTAAAASPLHAAARQQRWPSIRAGLEGLGLSQDAVARCKQLVLQASGEAQASLHRLSALLPHCAPLEELAALLPLLAAWGVPVGRTAVDPLLAPHADYFSGALWEVHLVDDGAASPVAVGGRYDALLRACWARQSAAAAAAAGMGSSVPLVAPLGGAGVTVSVERLVQVAAGGSRPALAAGGLRRLSSSDVLVCSRGSGGKAAAGGVGRLTERTSGRLMERVRLLRLLWDAGIAGEMLPSAAPSLTDQFAYANLSGIPWLVIINADEVAFHETVRVKQLNGKVEEDVAVAEVARYLTAALRGGDKGGGGSRPASSAAALRFVDEAEGEGDGEGQYGRERERRRREKRWYPHV